jgi:ribosomal RNA-processing protein 9
VCSLSKDGRVAFRGAKDGSLLMWDMESGKKENVVATASSRGDDGNRRELLTIATSDDGRFLAVGGQDGLYFRHMHDFLFFYLFIISSSGNV